MLLPLPTTLESNEDIVNQWSLLHHLPHDQKLQTFRFTSHTIPKVSFTSPSHSELKTSHYMVLCCIAPFLLFEGISKRRLNLGKLLLHITMVMWVLTWWPWQGDGLAITGLKIWFLTAQTCTFSFEVTTLSTSNTAYPYVAPRKTTLIFHVV